VEKFKSNFKSDSKWERTFSPSTVNRYLTLLSGMPTNRPPSGFRGLKTKEARTRLPSKVLILKDDGGEGGI
jgi:hypothetical protein